jgi:hypothetical protein
LGDVRSTFARGEHTVKARLGLNSHLRVRDAVDVGGRMKSLRSMQVAAICVALLLLGVASSGRDNVPSSGQRLPYRNSPMAKHHKGIELVRADAFSYRPYERVAGLGDTPTVTFQVTYLGSWPAGAQAAFQYALNIWGTRLNSPVPIRMWAEFANLPGNTLGKAGAEFIWANFTGAPFPDTWYVDAIADKAAGSDLDPDPTAFDIGAQFDSTPGAIWYFGTDAHPPAGTVDFVSVVLHELGHGLGFAGSAFVHNGLGYWGVDPDSMPGVYWPYSYDRQTRASGAPIIHFADGSLALANALTGGNLFFSSPVVADAYHPAISTPAKLYAPSTWLQGSSYSHLDEATYPAGNANSLMTPLILTAEANHNPGPITTEIFSDIGWGATGGGGAPGQPTVTSAVASGGVLTVTWTSGGGGAPMSHQLDFYSGGTFVASVPSGPGTTASIPLPPGVVGSFAVRVTAINGAGSSPASALFNFTIGGGGGAPGQPTVTSAVASGGVLTVTWTPGGGAAPTSHQLNFYSGATLVATVNWGASTTVNIPLPPGVFGTFGVKVTALNGTVAGPASNEYVFTIGPACTVPAAPIVTGGIVGGNGSVSWQAVPGAASYVVSAGTSPGSVEYLVPTNVGPTLAVGASGLPPGFFAWVRVTAVNACSQQGPATDFLVQ